MKRDRSRHYLLWVALAVVIIDALLKAYVHFQIPLVYLERVYPYGGIGLFEHFLGIQASIVHATNTGTLWGLFPGHPYVLMSLRSLFVVILIVYLVKFNKVGAARLPLVLVIAGAVGNILDILFYGHVVDMFRLILFGYDYPIFNIADAAIFCGVLSLLLLSFRSKRQESRG